MLGYFGAKITIISPLKCNKFGIFLHILSIPKKQITTLQIILGQTIQNIISYTTNTLYKSKLLHIKYHNSILHILIIIPQGQQTFK